MNLPKHIILVEDEAITQRYIKNIFEQYSVEIVGCFDNASDLLKHFKNLEFDMILMDINIKGSIDGIQLSREILKSSNVPIVFISAHSDDDTIEELLELAPYGFIGKPFSAKELLATVRIAYKRFLINDKQSDTLEKKLSIDNDIIITENYQYSIKMSELYKNGKLIKLNHKQRKILEIMVKNINHIIEYEQLVEYVWGSDDVADSSLRTLIYSLRKILPDLPIVSHSKIGYSLKN